MHGYVQLHSETHTKLMLYLKELYVDHFKNEPYFTNFCRIKETDEQTKKKIVFRLKIAD